MNDINTEKDELILEVAKKYPEMNTNQLSCKLNDLGILGNKTELYRRKKNSELLAEGLPDVDRYWREHNSREIMPLAMKRTKKALKDHTLNEKEVFPYVKLAFDKQFGEDLSQPHAWFIPYTPREHV